jgi:electron transport complex protein RnfA
MGMSLAVVVVMALSSAVIFPIQAFLLRPLGLEYMRVVVFILVIASLVQLVEFALKKYSPSLYNTLGIYLPLITTNCAVLAVVMLNSNNDYGFWASIFNGLGAGLGYMLAMVLFSGVRKMLLRCRPPRHFAGLPITLVAASLTSLAFTGFSGIVDNLFKK